MRTYKPIYLSSVIIVVSVLVSLATDSFTEKDFDEVRKGQKLLAELTVSTTPDFEKATGIIWNEYYNRGVKHVMTQKWMTEFAKVMWKDMGGGFVAIEKLHPLTARVITNARSQVVSVIIAPVDYKTKEGKIFTAKTQWRKASDGKFRAK
jgi:hypothetical protein